MSTTRLRNMAPVWLNRAVEHISHSLPGEERNIIKKGWDQLFLEPIRKEGFLDTVRAAQEVTMQERQEHVPLMPLAPEVLDVTDSEKIWQELMCES